ncbi:Histone deacetylase [Actinidia chinensis var. chinensis]|uniref:Histone deacetylase n=1 Tax=Actinidia chinensis var. chinensis TaxID=1590841 RepID=A0A2R6P785_ACTCC|nr:Histone deacetylase [Actinidia chinensis var. chinensis]
MEFWGVEVKAGKPLEVVPGDGKVIHISQAALGDGKKEKGNDLIPLRMTINGEKFVVGSLSGEKFPQIAFDLVFEKEFELSHDWKNGSVYFCGYSADNLPEDEDKDDFDSEDSEDDAHLAIAETGRIEPKVAEAKPNASKSKTAKPETSAKPKVTVVEPKKDDDSDESDDEDLMDASDDSVDSEDEDDSDSEDDSEDDEKTPTPKKAEPGKKRPTDSASETPVTAKKAKLDTPQKTDGKKGVVHTATPHPSKKGGKSPANSNKSKEQTPKSDGKAVSCKTCNKAFNSDGALQSHTKAKHAGK